MKRCISVTFGIDPNHYNKKDSAKGAVDLAIAMLRRQTSLPSKITVACEGVTRRIRVD